MLPSLSGEAEGFGAFLSLEVWASTAAARRANGGEDGRGEGSVDERIPGQLLGYCAPPAIPPDRHYSTYRTYLFTWIAASAQGPNGRGHF